jgi:hypothetical protein
MRQTGVLFHSGTKVISSALTNMDQLLEKPVKTLNKHLRECAREARAQAQLLPSGDLKDALLEKVGQYEAQIWTNTVLEEKQPNQPPSVSFGQTPSI